MKTRSTTMVFLLSVKELYTSSPAQTLFLGLTILARGIIPLCGLYALSNIVTAITGNASSEDLIRSSLVWVICIVLPGFIGSILIIQQSALAESLFRHLSVRLMAANSTINDLSVFENEDVHQDADIVRENISNRPVNLVVNIAGILSDFISVLSIAIALCSITVLSPLLAILLGVTVFITASKSQAKLWDSALRKNRQFRFMRYLFSLTLDRTSLSELRIYNVTGFILRKFQKEWTISRAVMNRARRSVGMLSALTAALAGIIVLIMVWDIFTMASGQTLAASEIVFLLQGIMTLQLTTRDFSEQIGWVRAQLLFFEKYFSCLDRGYLDRGERAAPSLPADRPPVIRTLELNGCSFDYGHDTWALQDISLVLKRGEIVAVVGANGSGKTTLTRVLLGLYQPTKGRLLVNGVSFGDRDARPFWNRCLYVPQNFARFQFLMKEVVTLGDERLNDFVDPLEPPEGTFWSKKDQQLGREFGGIDLSVGQWQRLALLRACVRHETSQVIVFDEPTASLDPLIESQVYDLIESLSADRISLFVTHRMSTVTHANRILLMDHGRIIADGSHEHLCDSCPPYRKMYEAQAGRYKQRAC